MGALQHTYAALTEQYAARFRRTLRPIRMIGREAEFPIVYPDGRAGDVSQLWKPLLARGGYVPRYDDPDTDRLIVALKGPDGTVEVEVGRATVELVLGPYEDLWQLAEGSTRLLRDVGDAAHQVGMRVLGLGIQPRSRSSPALMTPKRRYAYFAKAVGRAWWHFTATAADQVHVDITRSEIVDAVNTLNLLSAPLIALTANSSVYAGRPGRYLSGREGLLGTLGENRAGMTPRPFQSLEEFVRYICHYRCYVLRRNGSFRLYNRPFEKYLRDHAITQPWKSAPPASSRMESRSLWPRWLWGGWRPEQKPRPSSKTRSLIPGGRCVGTGAQQSCTVCGPKNRSHVLWKASSASLRVVCAGGGAAKRAFWGRCGSAWRGARLRATGPVR